MKVTTVKKTQKKETSKTVAKKAQPVKAAKATPKKEAQKKAAPKKETPKKAAPKKEAKAPVKKAVAKETVKKTVAKKPVAKKVEVLKKKVDVKEPKQPESTLDRIKIKPSSVDMQRTAPVSVTTERPKNVGVNPSRKPGKVVSYDNMKEDVAAAFKEKYPKGYSDYMADLFKVDKPDGTSFYAITLETEDALYLIKMVVNVDKAEDAQKSLFPDADSSDDIPTEGETFPDDNTENMSDSDDDSE